MPCPFCPEPNLNELVLKTTYWRAFLAWDQTYVGRCIVALNRHCEDLADLTSDEWIEFHAVVKQLESAMKKTFAATMFNWTCLMNDAFQETPPEPHVHWHFRPRYNHSVEIAGLLFEDLEFAHHYDRTKKHEISEAEKKLVVAAIQQNL
jgi:diadenosine tetraphosphate (Ap4A) HIT family hydrolase